MARRTARDVVDAGSSDLAAYAAWCVERLDTAFALDVIEDADGDTVGLWMSSPGRDVEHPRQVIGAWRETKGEDDADVANSCGFETDATDSVTTGAQVEEESGRAPEDGAACFVPLTLLARALLDACLAGEAPSAESRARIRVLWVDAGFPAEHADVLGGLVRASTPRDATDPRHRRAALRAWQNHFRPVLEDYLVTVDPDAVSLLQGVAAADRDGWDRTSEWLDDAVWAGIDGTFTSEAPLAEPLRRWPGHADLIQEAWKAAPETFGGGIPDLCAIVRAARPGEAVPRAVVRACEARAASVPALGRVPSGAWALPPDRLLPSPRDGDGEAMPATARLLAAAVLPTSWIPRDPEEWDAFDDVHPVLTMSQETLATDVDVTGFANAKGRWADLRRRLEEAAGCGPDAPHVTVATTCAEAADMVRALAWQVVVPCLHSIDGTGGEGVRVEDATRDAALDLSARLLLGGRSLRRVLEAAARWRQDGPARKARLARWTDDARLDPGWEAGLPDARYGEVEIICLTSASALRDDGLDGHAPDGTAGLDHCGASYASECMSGATRLLSVRTVDGSGRIARLSTVEMDLEGVEGPAMVQHLGLRNGRPPEAAAVAVARYVDDLSSGRLPWEPVTPVKGWTAPDGDRAEAGYDWSVPGALEALLADWRPHLPTACRGWGVTDFAGELGEHLGARGRFRLSVATRTAPMQAALDGFVASLGDARVVQGISGMVRSLREMTDRLGR